MTMPVRVAAAFVLAACAPTLDWREVRPEGGAVQAQFPCRPDSQVRRIALAGAAVNLSLHACSAAQTTFALAFADVEDPARVAAALDELANAAQRNIGATAGTASALRIEGMTPNPGARRLHLQGRLPDGQAVQEQVALFTRGTRVYQVSMVGATLDAAAVESFFGALRLPT